jgi:hypothetical protein
MDAQRSHPAAFACPVLELEHAFLVAGQLDVPPPQDLTVAALAPSVPTASTPASTSAEKTMAVRTRSACLVTMEIPLRNAAYGSR